MEGYIRRIERARKALGEADKVLIGGGAGLSAAAGLEYAGERFENNFADFIGKYGMTDMYTAGFYPFATEEEKWAYWARHIEINLYKQEPTQLYSDLKQLVDGKDFFVVTTNVESQFEKAGFPKNRIFEVQGNYGFLQCAKGCHSKRYDNEKLINTMASHTKDCRIPSYLVPKCPVCGGPMEVNLRKDQYFVQDEAWYVSNRNYERWLKRAEGSRLVLLELGVGYNTPGIIRYPFEQMAYGRKNAVLIRMNRDYPAGAEENKNRTIAFTEEIKEAVGALLEE